MVISDEKLNYWAEVFIRLNRRHGLLRQGLRFDHFIQTPEFWQQYLRQRDCSLKVCDISLLHKMNAHFNTFRMVLRGGRYYPPRRYRRGRRVL